MKTNLLAIFLFVFSVFAVDARVDPEKLKKMKDRVQLSGTRFDCQPSTASYCMEINNVRAGLLAAGDMWWDLQNGKYIVPKPAQGFPEVSSIFASGIWIGGVDPNGAIKLAGVTYRNGDNTDYYSGPLDQNGQTDLEKCSDWDRHFVVKGDNIRLHLSQFQESQQQGIEYDCDLIPDDVKYWPARGNPYFNEEFDFELPDQNLADFWDQNGDGIYNPCNGDHPITSQRGCENYGQFADEIVFWMFNDNGGPHRLSLATPIQMEVQAHAFAFVTTDELNDMTFYKFKLLNKASDDIRDCYFGLWVDPDLGCSEDDYIGCDVSRSLAYVYNEDDEDGSPGSSCPGGINTYGENIPLVGIDLFRGPRGPKVFKRDQDGNILQDENGNKILLDPTPGTGEQDTIVELGMSSFTYQNRGVSNPPEATRDPEIDFEFYNILQGKWKDGTPITFGGSGFDPASADTVKYVFSDEPGDPFGWSMCTADLPFDDRRFVMATGPLLLQPGAVNEMVLGVPFVPDIDYPCPSIQRLQFADDLAQALFDNCFEVDQTIDAPDMKGINLDQQLILLLSNGEFSNNANEEFKSVDLRAPPDTEDPYYRFEGYLIYQLADANVNSNELDNIEKARLVRQVDVKNGVGEIYNWFPIPNPDPTVTDPIWIPERQVAGEDLGIRHSFSITEDAFALSDPQLQNGKEYHYTVLAYAYNNYMQYNVQDNIGQRTPYIQSGRNVRVYTLKPRSLSDVEIPTMYGQEAAVTRIDGIGTGFNALDMDLTEEELDQILFDTTFNGEILYKAGNSPINPKVVNPLRIKDGRYRLEIEGEFNDSTSNTKLIRPGATWKMTNLNTGDVIFSNKTIDEINEQIIPERGFSIEVNQIGDPGDQFDANNGALTQTFEYADSDGIDWWNAIPAYTGIEYVDQSGSQFLHAYTREEQDDPNDALVQIDGGLFIPILSAKWRTPMQTESPYISPAWLENQGFATSLNPARMRLKDLNNVDIVFTSDKTKWSKCIVVETSQNAYTQNGYSSRGNRDQFEMRSDASIDQNGNVIPGETGRSYFPGYAIDVETGKRLNIFFGENSSFNPENDATSSAIYNTTVNSGGIGSDMIWNPTGELFTNNVPQDGPVGAYGNFVGGQHYIYVTRQPYDECQALSELFESGGILNLVEAVSFITWTGIPLPKEPLLSLDDGLIPNDFTAKLRVTNPFNRELISPNLRRASIFEAIGTLPVYEFGFEGVEVTDPVSTEEPKLLDNIIISPNPLIRSSTSGSGQWDNVVRISNLPKGSEVSVYSLQGQFIARMDKNTGVGYIDNGISQTLEWDLRDNNGLPILSGTYIVHVVIPHLGMQKSFKWIVI
ncbi:MAG: hypothetical protein AAGA77_21635 [Bacteroidota bacterium]